MELLCDKIKRLIKENGYAKPTDFYAKIKEIYPEQAVSIMSLYRILDNKITTIQRKTLSQIATALMIKVSDLKKGTDAEFIKESTEEKGFVYSGGSSLKILEKNLPFVIKQLTLKNTSCRFLEDEFKDAKPTMLSTEALLDAIEQAGLPMPDKFKYRGDFNKLDYFLKMKNLHTKFPKLKLPPEAVKLTQQKTLNKSERMKLNRLVLEAAFPHQCPKIPKNRLRTDIEQDDPNAKESLKWVFVTSGRMNIIIEGKDEEIKKTIVKDEGFSFDARQRHCFENLSLRATKALIIHYPALNNIFYDPNSLK